VLIEELYERNIILQSIFHNFEVSLSFPRKVLFRMYTAFVKKSYTSEWLSYTVLFQSRGFQLSAVS
jgi:hypothetical protein